MVGVCEVEGRGEQTELGPLERTLPAGARYERCPICKVDLPKAQKLWLDQRHIKCYAHETSSQG